MSMIPQSNLGEEVRDALRMALEQITDKLRTSVYSPRIKLLSAAQVEVG